MSGVARSLSGPRAQPRTIKVQNRTTADIRVFMAPPKILVVSCFVVGPASRAGPIVPLGSRHLLAKQDATRLASPITPRWALPTPLHAKTTQLEKSRAHRRAEAARHCHPDSPTHR